MRLTHLSSLLLGTCLLSACGGSNDDSDTPTDGGVPPTSFDHQVIGTVVYQGAVAGAEVCVDLNQNASCDTDEPSTIADVDGKYQIDWSSDVEMPVYDLIANWQQAAETATKPALLKAAFRTDALNANASKSDSNQGVISMEGVGKLVALQEHGGEINPMTHLEYQRVARMRAAGTTSLDIVTQRGLLAALLLNIYERDGNPYKLSAEQSLSPEFVDTYQLHRHLEALIGEQLGDVLAVDDIMSITRDQLRDLVDESGMSTEDYLASDPMAVRFLVNNALIAEEYIETPIDAKIMSDADWQVITTNYLEEGQQPSMFNLGPAILEHFFTLDYGNPELSFIGRISDNQVTGLVLRTPVEEDDHLECWNTDMKKWINPDRKDQGYQPPAMTFIDNTMNSVYSGTNVPVTIEFTKYSGTGEEWQAILSTTPPALKLAELNWPSQVYRYRIHQAEDVMCRTEEFDTKEMPLHQDPQQLTTADVARLSWPSLYPDELVIDEENQRITNKMTEATFEWSLIDSPSDQSIIHIVEIVEPQFANFVLATDYLIDGADIFEVMINKGSSEYSQRHQHLSITYDGEEDGFNQRFYKHLEAIVKGQ
ncbi:hypothetical protein GNT65_12860 [Shewanella sp. JBTF-M18]|uniref:Carboxypeptidase regulatory-like domain-containing protein n=1 Tax=Shewanella insulae TaxID=2681496 RepID=A0A6L7I0S1_9GAMM|nr:hypothetical protein [Shewanella insulae]MXR69554.1 hypothetical protein [Shewanella insulae]